MQAVKNHSFSLWIISFSSCRHFLKNRIKIYFGLVFKCVPARKLEAVFHTREMINKNPQSSVISWIFTIGFGDTESYSEP